MYEFLILAQLSRRPMHGYLIAKVIGAMSGPFRHVQWGALYPVLTRLERDGLIRAEADTGEGDGRTRNVYAITEAGRVRLHEHLMDTEHHAAEYSPAFCQKVALFHQLTPEERVRLCRHYAVYAQQHIDHLERKGRDLAVTDTLSDAQRADIAVVMAHRIEHWKHERAWAELLIDQHSKQEAL